MTHIRRQRDELLRTTGAPPLLLLIDDEPWMADALCAQTDPEAFFPGKGGSGRQATAICLSCTVQRSCLTYALDHAEKFGIWGGTTWIQRRRLLRAGGDQL